MTENNTNEIKIQIAADELRKRSLYLGLPCYGGQCSAKFTESLIGLSRLFQHHGIRLEMNFLTNESLITRARNYLAESFMESGCTHMMFIDSDIGFQPNDVLALLALQSDDSEYDILGACYPKKSISWEKIRNAVNKGVGEENPLELERFMADFVFNAKPGCDIYLNKPSEVSELGTGFMMIRRNTFEKVREAFPELLYTPDHIRSEGFDGSKKIMCYFDAAIDPNSNRYLSEDYFFCRKAGEIGLKTWICPWMSLTHFGGMGFTGSMADIAAIGSSLTADPEEMKKMKKGKKK